MQCKVRLIIVNDQYILHGKHEHNKPLHLPEIKKKIETSEPFENTRMIKKKIISKWVQNDVKNNTVMKKTNYYL